MKKKFLKTSCIIAMIFTMILCSTVFADTTIEVGSTNLNSSINNSAKVGDILKHPEDGWKRYDDSVSEITYIGKWSTNTSSTQHYNVHAHFTNTVGDVCRVNFTGTKIRIITPKARGFGNVQISIDGEQQTFSEYEYNTRCQVLSFEKLDLQSKNHWVEIKSLDGKAIVVDALDIDATAEIKPFSIPVETLKLDKTSLSMVVNQVEQITAKVLPENAVNKNIEWGSSDPSVATVDQNGKVTATGIGTAIITATTKDGSNIKDTCTVTVTDLSKNRAVLSVTYVSGMVREYNLPMNEINDFIKAFKNRASSGSDGLFVVNMPANNDPYASKKEYIVLDKVQFFDVNEYAVSK